MVIGGGVGLLYKTVLNVKSRPTNPSFKRFEYMDCTFIHYKSVRIIVVYRPPPSTDNALTVDLFFNEFSILMEEVITSNAELVIVGDFNFHVDVSDDGNSTRFSSLLENFNLKQHVRVCTHLHGHILDLVITRSDADVYFLTNLSTLEQPLSDRKPTSS